MSRLNARQIKIVQEALDGAAEMRSYSGRGMYGKSCLGIVGSPRQCGEAVAGAIQFMKEELIDKVHDERDARDEQTAKDGMDGSDAAAEDASRNTLEYSEDVDAIVLELVAHASTDSMGRSDMVMYWEGIPALPHHEQ